MRKDDAVKEGKRESKGRWAWFLERLARANEEALKQGCRA
jgi:hypothetical protein